MVLFQSPINPSEPWYTSNYRHADSFLWLTVMMCAICAILILVEYLYTHKNYHLIWILTFFTSSIVFSQVSLLGTYRFVISPIGAALTISIPGGIATGMLYSVFENQRFLEKISYGTIFLLFLSVMMVVILIFGMNSESFIITGMMISNIISTSIVIFVPFYSTFVTKKTSNAAFLMTAYGVLAGLGGIFMSNSIGETGDMFLVFFGIGLYSYILALSKFFVICGVLFENKWGIPLRKIGSK